MLPIKGQWINVNPAFIDFLVASGLSFSTSWMSTLRDLARLGNPVKVIEIFDHPQIQCISRLKVGEPLDREFDLWKTGSLLWFHKDDPPVFLLGANMVPKKGDLVFINSNFISEMDATYPNTWWVKDLLRDVAKRMLPVHVDYIDDNQEGDPSLIEVGLNAPIHKSFSIRKNGTFYRLPEKSAPMFLIGDQKVHSIGVENLKSLNTDGRTTCAVCGCQLKDPGMGLAYRYCPKCEP